MLELSIELLGTVLLALGFLGLGACIVVAFTRVAP